MTVASMGHQTRLGSVAESTYGTTPAPGTIAALNEEFVFVSENLRKTGVIVERDGIRGTRSHVADDTRTGPYTVAGTIVLEPTPEDLAIWLPRILGQAPSGNTYALAESLPSFTLGVDRVGRKFRYSGCKVNRAVFSGAEGGLLRLSLDIVGKEENVETTAWPSLTASVTQPYIFSDVTLTLVSASREVKDFELSIDNSLVTDRFMNSTTVVNLPEGDRIVTLRTTHAYDATANLDLYGQALAGSAGALAFTNGGYSTTFTFGTLQVPDNSPVVGSKAEIPLTLEMVARKTGADVELEVTHDSVP